MKLGIPYGDFHFGKELHDDFFNLQIFRVINSLSSPAVYQTLPTNFKAAVKILKVELHSLRGLQSRKQPKGLFTYSSKGSTYDIQNWLKGIRDSG